MPGATRSSLWSGLPEKTISMRPTLRHLHRRCPGLDLANSGGTDLALQMCHPRLLGETADAPRLGSKRAKGRKGQHGASTPAGVDKSALALPEPRRIRDKEHVRF